MHHVTSVVNSFREWPTFKLLNIHSRRDHLVGLVVKASASRAADSSSIPVATLSSAWCYWGQRWDWLARWEYTVTG